MALQRITPMDPTEDNFGGNLYLLVADVRWIDPTTYPRVRNQYYNGPINLLPGFSWQRFDFIEETIAYDELPTDIEGNDGYEVVLEAYAAKDRPELQAATENNRKVRVVAILCDSNGLQKVIGSIHAPATFTLVSVSHKDVYAGRSEVKVNLVNQHVYPSPFYDYTPPAAMACAPVTIVDQDGGFVASVSSGSIYAVTAFTKISGGAPTTTYSTTITAPMP